MSDAATPATPEVPAAPSPAAPAAPQPISDYTPFYSNLSDENKQVFAARKFEPAKTTANDLLDTIRNQDKLIGTNTLPPPNTADDKALASWPGWKALGVPEKPEEYQLKRLEKLPDGMPWDEEGEKVLRQAMLGAHVPAKYAQGVLDAIANLQTTRYGAFAQSQAEAKTAMDTELGKAWGAQKDANMALAKNAAATIAEKAGVKLEPGEIADRFSTLYGDANAIRILHYLGTALGEDVMKGGGGGAGGIGTPDAAKAELARLDTDAEFQKARNDRDHPGHNSAKERWEKLMQIAHPGMTK